jgi:lysophospholipase L1-like esterase
VRLFGIDLENTTGAVVDNLGIVSVNVKSFAAGDAAHWSTELAHRSADLVMIMIGANEAQWLGPGDKDTKEYQSHYDKILAPIRKARPDAACLVVSPTDQAEAKDGEYPSRPVMPVLVEAQRKAALAAGCGFYSTYDWMGGKGSAAKWYRNGLVGSDFQHLSRKGANKMADAVYDALMSGFQRYAAH